jgi:hypothetical protein
MDKHMNTSLEWGQGYVPSHLISSPHFSFPLTSASGVQMGSVRETNGGGGSGGSHGSRTQWAFLI